MKDFTKYLLWMALKYHFKGFMLLCPQNQCYGGIRLWHQLLNVIFMDLEIRKILLSWESSLIKFGKIDSWNLAENLAKMGCILRKRHMDAEEWRIIKFLRDTVISGSFNTKSILKTIQKTLLLDHLEEKNNYNSHLPARKKGNRPLLNGQEVRFKGETEKIFKEKLRFKKGMPLRNFDIETESAFDSRKVRRIVEKRMCQAYHRMNKKEEGYKSTNNERYWMNRATSFQLYNIGQKENVEQISRGLSTHWKRQYDPLTHKVVFKKKMAYKDKMEAKEAIALWIINHPDDKREMVAYKCSECNSWHIGHRSPILHHPALESLVPHL